MAAPKGSEIVKADTGSFCYRSGHLFVPVENAVTRKNVEGGTEISHAFYCKQCCQVQHRVVAFWPKSSTGKSTEKEPF
jgi:hypothetical protein